MDWRAQEFPGNEHIVVDSKNENTASVTQIS